MRYSPFFRLVWLPSDVEWKMFRNNTEKQLHQHTGIRSEQKFTCLNQLLNITINKKELDKIFSRLSDFFITLISFHPNKFLTFYFQFYIYFYFLCYKVY